MPETGGGSAVMEHTETRRNLSAYLDDAVDPAEKAQIEAHLAQCGNCRQALAELEKTIGHLKGLPEVEPPPWLTVRIMAHVRAEAAPRRSLWRWLFVPFQVKLPLEALALVFICVTGYFLARSNAPQGVPVLSSPPAREEAPAPAPEAPAPVAQSPMMRKNVSPVPLPRKSLPPAVGTAPVAPAAPAQQATKEEPAYAPPLPTAPIPAPAAPAAASPAPAAKSDVAEEPARGKMEADSMTRQKGDGASLQSMGKKAKQAKAGPSYASDVGRGYAGGSTPAGAGPEQEPQAKPFDRVERAEIALRVNDPAAAVGPIEEAVSRCGGMVVKRNYGESGHLLVVRIPPRGVPRLTDLLAKIGTLQKEPQGKGDAGPAIELTIRW